MILLTLCTVAALQGEPAQTPPPARGRWSVLNGVEVVVNGDVITRRRLERILAREVRRYGVTTRSEFEQLQAAIYRNSVDSLLMRQGGEYLGIQPEDVERLVDNWWNWRTTAAGGVKAMQETLEKQQLSAADQREIYSEDVLRRSFENTVTGKDRGPGGRVIQDRFVRPGERRAAFDRICRDRWGLDAIGGRAPRLLLQELLIPVRASEPPEAARELLEDLLAQVEEGEEFAVLVEEFGERANDGVTEPLTLAEVESLFGRQLAGFLREAPAGSVTPPQPFMNGEEVVAWRAVQLREVRPESAPSFDALEVQAAVERRLLETRDDVHRDRALDELLTSSYVWLPGGDAGRSGAEPR
ncbi:MAG: hypothetical protein QF903_05600 [Planctomycetota bacterium]|jgi:hypothetical protein|nr:hypothetical protein [Planctomycetota bacterium]MDP6763037.1 hypothetical protein [Planctomycetota bacterium]MDP6988934.1 hypothetical protein [Planctomycetota bacterium]